MPPRPPLSAEPLPRAMPLPETANGSWPLQPRADAAAAPSAAHRTRCSGRAAGLAAANHTPKAPPRPPRDTLAALADELSRPPDAAAQSSAGYRASKSCRAAPSDPTRNRHEVRQEARQEPARTHDLSRDRSRVAGAVARRRRVTDERPIRTSQRWPIGSKRHYASRARRRRREPLPRGPEARTPPARRRRPPAEPEPAAASAAAQPAPQPPPVPHARRNRPNRSRMAKPSKARARRSTTVSNKRWRVCWAVQRARPDGSSIGAAASGSKRWRPL